MMLQTIGPLTNIQYRLLRARCRGKRARGSRAAFDGKSNVDVLCDKEVVSSGVEKTFIDLGRAIRLETIELAKLRAEAVIALEVRADVLQIACANAKAAGVPAVRGFGTSTYHDRSLAPRDATPQRHILT